MRKFVSAQLKIERAKCHIADLEARRETFLGTNPCKVRPEYNPQTGFTDYIVEDFVEVDPVISLVIGDIVHNLRSALDHLVAALVMDNGGTVGPDTCFPISKSAQSYASAAPGKINGASIADQQLIDSFKPYLGGNDALWGLHRMDITDKHVLILTQVHCASGISYRLDPATADELFGNDFSSTFAVPEDESITIPFIDPIGVPKKGDVLVRFPGNTEKDENKQPAFDIAFGDVEVFKGRLVVRSVYELANLVLRIVKAFV